MWAYHSQGVFSQFLPLWWKCCKCLWSPKLKLDWLLE
jgi:hypothetical protein